MPKIKNLVQRTVFLSSRLIKSTVKYALYLHLGTQAAYCGNDLLHSAQPSLIRSEFNKTIGFPIKGWSEDVEENIPKIFQAVRVLEKEKAIGPFELESIRIESPHYLQKNILEQLSFLAATRHGGYFHSVFKEIVVNETVNPAVVHHEVKHTRTYKLLKEHPEFREKWEALAVDETGNSLYFSGLEQICSAIKVLNEFVDKEKLEERINEELGFVSTYARTNFFEDVAETGELAEDANIGAAKAENWLLGEQRNPKIIAKLKLAEEYGIISKGFREYAALSRQLREAAGFHGEIDLTATGQFMEASQNFLEKYPGNIYTLSLRLARGEIVYRRAISHCKPISSDESTSSQESTFDCKSAFAIEEAIKEFKLGLTAPYKDLSEYFTIIGRLKEIHASHTRNDFAYKIYAQAEEEYLRRLDAYDFILPSKGVNDLLRIYGEL